MCVKAQLLQVGCGACNVAWISQAGGELTAGVQTLQTGDGAKIGRSCMQATAGYRTLEPMHMGGV